MSLAKTWYTPEEARSKYGMDISTLMKWVEEGLVRCEQRDSKVMAVNGDDIELKIKEYVKRK
jgi:predicted site-specific integrase-resolvase